MICAVDQTEHQSLEDLHKHLRRLKVTQETYYTQYAPVLDRHTGEPIPFKAPATDYLKKEFVTKRTMKAWFKANPDLARDWSLQWLLDRKEEKGLTYAPTQVELRSLPCPSMASYEELFEDGYRAAAESVGLLYRFDGALPAPTKPPGRIIVDTREQKPLTLSVPTLNHRLVCGDYGLEPQHDVGIYIDRKSLGDLLGTLSKRETRHDDSNYDRFTRELERAAEMGTYVVMLVEQSLNDCLAFNSIPYLKRQFGKAKVSPEHVFHNLRSLLQAYPLNFQALFVENREEAARAVVRVLAAKETVKSVDLQWAYDSKALFT